MAENQKGQLKIRDWPTWLNWYQRTILLWLSVLVVSILRPATLSAFVTIDIPMSPGPAEVQQHQSHAPEAISVPPSVITSTLGAGLQQVFGVFRCFDLTIGEFIPDAIVDLTANAVNGTGGHLHTDPGRPDGAWEPESGSTGPGGEGLLSFYTVPEVSGEIGIGVECSAPGFVDVSPEVDFTIGVRIATPLVGLPPSGNGFVTEASVGHDLFNVFVTPEVNVRLLVLPIFLRLELLQQGVPEEEIPTIRYTSMSLFEGGLFDVDANGDGLIDNPWMRPHVSHRFGTDVDIGMRGFPAEFRDELAQIILKFGFAFPVLAESPAAPQATHWHLRK